MKLIPEIRIRFENSLIDVSRGLFAYSATTTTTIIGITLSVESSS